MTVSEGEQEPTSLQVGELVAASLAWPATLAPAADPYRLPATTPIDLTAAWWLPLSERLTPGASWLMGIGIVVARVLVPRLARRPRVGALAPSEVDTRLCTGCNQCPQDCPWEAITMVPREDGRPKLVALVNPAPCVSFGVCAASCAPMGVGPAGRTGRDQLARLRDEALPVLAAQPVQSIVAVVCAQAPASHRDALDARGAYVHEVSCAGNLHTSAVERFLRDGAPRHENFEPDLVCEPVPYEEDER